ncbi:fibronectin type III domain-containing protein, partial [candidate division KSB1 bacterium]|nr:fibronectin type III domain-containing protein [candidate division KSB1 bacterium]
MRKSVPILCLFLLQVMVGSAPAIDITIPDASAPAGKSITVALQTTDMTGKGIYSLDFTVIFNGSVLSVTNVLSSGTLLSTWGAPTFNSSNGQVRVSSGGTAPLTGTGNFVKIVFQVAANAAAGTSSPMAFSAFTFNDGSPIPQLYNGTFTVVQDNEPPVFTSDPQAESVTVHSATITWRTDEPATSVVQWGETPSYGQVTRSDELVTVHSVTLTGLRAGRTFNFRAGGSDKHGNGPSWSAGNEFTTPDIVVSLPDAALDPGTMVTIPVRVSDVSGQDITSINMTVQYNRDILTANGVLSEGTMVDNWPSPLFSVSAGQVSVDLSGSTALTGSGILVKLQMQVKNSVPIGRRTALHFADLQLNSGDVPVVARDGQFTVRDTRAPVITGGPQADQITATGAKIIWTTDEKATSKVEFGKDESYGFTEYSYLRTTDHSITLSGLEPETVYYYRVSSTDSSGNGPVKSGNFTFLTAAGGNIVIDLADLSANVGSTVIVPVTTTDISGQGVTSLYAVIGYDRQLLQFERVTTNNSLSAAWQNLLYDSIDGLVTVQNRGNEPLSNSGTLFFCHFRILSNIYNGRTELRFNRFLYNQGWPQVTVRNGELEITGRPDVRPPEFIQTPFVDRIMEFSARIFWTTALPTIGEVSYGQTAAFGKFLYSSEPATVHSVLINDLEPGMDWSYRVKITNPVNSLSTLSDNLSFHTPAGTPVSVSLPDVVQPAGSAFSMAVETGNLTGLNVYSAYLVLRYDQRYLSVTDVSSSSTISSGWGTPVFTITPGRVVITMGGVTPLKNSGKLVELAFRLAENAPQDEKFPVWFESCFYNEGEPETSPSSGLVTVQDIFSPSITQGPQVFALTPNSATLLWATDEPATSQVEYGTSPGFGDVKSSFQLNTGHLLVLSNLQPNTLYYYQISSQDVSGNGPVNSSVETFITPGLQFLTLSVSDQIAPPSADISIPVRVSDVTAASVLSIGFDLVFDPNIIEITGADVDGCFTQNWGQISFEKKNGRVFVLLKGSSVLTGSGILANIRARVNAGATIGAVSPLTLSNVLINGINVPANLQNGVLTVGDSDPPQIVSGPYTGSITAYSAEIIWYTDEPANSTVAFGTTPALGQEKTLQKLTREHKVVLDNLLPDTRIYYKTGSSDQFRNGPTWSELQNFTTLNAQDIRLFLPDTTADPGDELTLPLRISGVTGREIMACSLRILLDEDITALSTETSGTLIAGWNAPLMQMQGNVVAFTLSGDQPLTGAGDLLRMRVKISENTIPGSSLSLFFLQATFNNSDLPVQLNNGRIKINDTSPPKITNGPLVRNITATTAVIAWSTDEASTSRVEYGTTQQYGFERSGSGLVREHEIKLSGLQPNTTYHYRVSSTDSVQNGPTTSSDAVFMTVSDTAVRVSLQDSSALPDETLLLPVRLGDMPGTITKFQCMILYDPLNLTIEGVTQQNTLTQNWPDFILTPGDGQIFISAEGGTVSESGILFNLQISISSGAQPGQTAIDFDQFIFNDGVPQAQASGCRINIIDNLPPVIVYGPAATAITTTSATIVWQTDEAANSMVEYGRTLNLGLSKTDTRLITDHEITLRDLVPSTLYYYRGNSTDARGNGPTQSQVLSFKTANISGIYLALPETLAAAGEIDIPVQMKNMSGTALQSAELEIESDPEIVTFKGVLTDNSESADWPDPVVNISSGKININLSGPPVLATEGIFIFIRCQIAADAGIGEKAPLIFSKTICNNGDIPVTAKNGRIVIKDNTLPQFVVSPKVTEIFYNGATLAWETDEITTGYAEYGTTPQFGTFVDDPKLSLQHQISITGLQPTTRYYYKVGIVDSSGNGPVVSPAGAFTTREETLYISSPDTSASAGSVILWPIFISFTGGYQIRKVEISVTYDPQVLTASGAQQNGTIAEDWPQPLFSDSRGELKITM